MRTHTEIAETLAVKGMGWEWFDDSGKYAGCWHKGTTDIYGDMETFTRDFSPATDDNHLRMVLEKLSEEQSDNLGMKLFDQVYDDKDILRKYAHGLMAHALRLPTETLANLICDVLEA